MGGGLGGRSARLDLVKSFETVHAIFLVPGQAGGEVLLDVGGERAENLVVSINIIDVRFVSAESQWMWQ